MSKNRFLTLSLSAKPPFFRLKARFARTDSGGAGDFQGLDGDSELTALFPVGFAPEVHCFSLPLFSARSGQLPASDFWAAGLLQGCSRAAAFMMKRRNGMSKNGEFRLCR